MKKTRFIANAITLALAIPFTALAADQPTLGARGNDIIKQGSLTFKDLDKDGALTPYEDWRLTPRQRAEDLVSRRRPE